MVKEIPLTRGYVALVDDDDFDWLNQWKWCAKVDKHTVYAVRNGPMVKGVRSGTIRMHREILGAPPGVDVDHRDTDGLNNRRNNLRESTKAQNQCNQRPRVGASSQFKGVTWCKWYNRWVAHIGVNRKCHFLGYYDIEIDAAKAYNEAALKHFGEFARLNEIPESEAA